ncbi:3-hydroxyacyl-CoA dehydrogenase family protein [Natrarchaeobius sp. A-rgal3]|uniref:3-hydroxyacyl-CoA dehydrogenase family protein n=1 Tax=Natrarchaeobius versutus TaxID=1679078 RepID=UPI00350FBDF0
MVEINHIGIIGGGIMGGGIGQTLAQHGYSVSIRDVDEDAIADTKERVKSGKFGLESAVKGGYLTEDEKEAALDRITFTLDIEEAVEDADVIFEAVPEDIHIKGRVFRQLDELTDDVPLFSNTSGFSIAALGNAVEDPSRVGGAHFFSPVPVMSLVEVVKTPQIDEEYVEAVRELAEDVGKTTVVLEDSQTEYGFIVNRIWGAMMDEAKAVVNEGIATQEEVNLAMKEGRNLPVGPLEGPGIGEEW